MYILQNALKNLVRNKGRNLLTGAIIFVIIVASIISLMINISSNVIIREYKAQFGAKVLIQPDTSKLQVMSGKTNQTVPLSKVYTELAKSKDLLSADLTCTIPCTSDTLKGIGDNGANGSVGFTGGGSNATAFPSMNIIGYTNYQKMDDFVNKYRGISEGEFFKNANECIISEDFAKQNSIKAGDTIKLEQGNVAGHYITLKVTGIYFDLTKNPQGDNTPAVMNRRNEILTTFDTANDANADWTSSVYTASYELKNPSLLPDFRNEARKDGLSTDYLVTTDEASYNKIVGPVEGLSKISLAFMIVVLILGGIILILLSSLSIRERKYEIGVLRAMGMKKAKVACGLILETLMITFACLVFGLGLGTVSAQPVSNMLLQNQIQAAEQASTQDPGITMIFAGAQSNPNAKPLSQLTVNLSPETICILVFIALLLVALSCAAGIRYITKYEPIKILTERN